MAELSDAVAVGEAAEVVTNLPETISKLSEMAGRLMYGTGYTVAYVIVFPAALIFAAIPKGNALVEGVLEGSAAARSKAEGIIG